MSLQDRPTDWGDLGRRVRQAAEDAVARGTIEDSVVEVRRQVSTDPLRGPTPSALPLTTHRSHTVRSLIAESPAEAQGGSQ